MRKSKLRCCSGYFSLRVMGVASALLFTLACSFGLFASPLDETGEYYDDSLSKAGTSATVNPTSADATYQSSTGSIDNLGHYFLEIALFAVIVILVVQDRSRRKTIALISDQNKTLQSNFTEAKRLYQQFKKKTAELEKRVLENSSQVRSEIGGRTAEQPDAKIPFEVENMILGQITLSIVREIATPVTTIKNSVQTLRVTVTDMVAEIQKAEMPSTGAGSGPVFSAEYFQTIGELSDDALELMHVISKGTSQTMEIVKKLNLFNALDKGTLQVVGLNDSIDTVLYLLRDKLDARIVIKKHYQTGIAAVNLSYGTLNYLIINILLHSIRSVELAPTEGVISIFTEMNDGKVCFRIHDNGPGALDEMTNKGIESFIAASGDNFSGASGLFIIHEMIRENQGSMLVTSQHGQGTEIKVALPASSK